MDDLAFSSDDGSPLGLEDYRLLKLVSKTRADFVKLSLRYKFDDAIPNRLAEQKLILRGDSGWPGVPGYRITDAGDAALKEWLRQGRM